MDHDPSTKSLKKALLLPGTGGWLFHKKTLQFLLLLAPSLEHPQVVYNREEFAVPERRKCSMAMKNIRNKKSPSVRIDITLEP